MNIYICSAYIDVSTECDQIKIKSIMEDNTGIFEIWKEIYPENLTAVGSEDLDKLKGKNYTLYVSTKKISNTRHHYFYAVYTANFYDAYEWLFSKLLQNYKSMKGD